MIRASAKNSFDYLRAADQRSDDLARMSLSTNETDIADVDRENCRLALIRIFRKENKPLLPGARLM